MWLNHINIDPDLVAIIENPRFKALISSAEARLGAA
jgi:hypothetical protein